MDKLRAVLVGCGGISGAWLSASRHIADLQIIGLVDLDRSRAASRADEYMLSDALIDTDLTHMLSHTQPDVVFDCTLPEAHLGVTLEAFKHGCHVLGEKPIADTLPNARRMVAAAQAKNRIYAVTQNRRYDPNIRALKHFLADNKIGNITSIHSDFFLAPHFDGFRATMKHPLLIDMAIHTFDAARYLTGCDPISVYCKEWNPAGSWFAHDASAIAVFELSDGVMYTYRGSWAAEGLMTTWESEWRIVGQRGSALWDGATALRAQKVAAKGGFFSAFEDLAISPEPLPEKLTGHAGVIREFVHSIRAGIPPETVCTDNIKSLAMVFSAVESAESGKPVRIKL